MDELEICDLNGALPLNLTVNLVTIGLTLCLIFWSACSTDNKVSLPNREPKSQPVFTGEQGPGKNQNLTLKLGGGLLVALLPGVAVYWIFRYFANISDATSHFWWIEHHLANSEIACTLFGAIKPKWTDFILPGLLCLCFCIPSLKKVFKSFNTELVKELSRCEIKLNDEDTLLVALPAFSGAYGLSLVNTRNAKVARTLLLIDEFNSRHCDETYTAWLKENTTRVLENLSTDAQDNRYTYNLPGKHRNTP